MKHDSLNQLLNAPIVIAAADALGAANVRLVGGAVRDLIYGLTPDDLDMATSLPPQDVMQVLKAKGHRVVPTGLGHGTVTLILDGVPLEITTLRRDVTTDGRHATVAFTDDWREDARRRDFTFNALSLTMTGEVKDYFGGVDDLSQGHVKFVGDARQRISEDYLRILRYFRFYARYGKTEPTRELEDVLRQESANLEQLSGERIQKEILNLLPLAGASKSLALMSKFEIDKQLFNTKFDLSTFEELSNLEAFHKSPSALRRLAVLLGKDLTLLIQAASKLKLSNHQTKRLKAMATECSLPLHEALYRLGPEFVVDQILLDSSFSSKDLETAASWSKPAFPISGKDLMDLGYTAGTQLGNIKTVLENRWIESDFTLSKGELLSGLIIGKPKK